MFSTRQLSECFFFMNCLTSIFDFLPISHNLRITNAQNNMSDEKTMMLDIGVREGILLGGRKKFALKITICPKNRQLALKLTF